MAVDYDVYAEGEALLGWLNATFRLSAPSPFDGNRFLERLADDVRDRLAGAGVEIAHFKMTLAPDTGNDLAVLNLVRTDGRPESPHRLAEELTDGELIVNLRAEGDPGQLNAIALAGLEQAAREAGVSGDGRAQRTLPARPARADAPDGDAMTSQVPRILYCHCAYAKVVPPEVKSAVLNGLTEADVEFDAVPDLCEMAAHGDDRLRDLAARGPLKIAACYPRAVKWLFAAAGAQLPDSAVRIWNMRVEAADVVLSGLLNRSSDGSSDRSGDLGDPSPRSPQL